VQASLASDLLALASLSFEQAPPEALLAGGAVALLALGGLPYAGVQASRGAAAAEPASPSPLPRENALLVFGSTGRMGCVLVDSVRVGEGVAVQRRWH
jgi:hypothetical protein